MTALNGVLLGACLTLACGSARLKDGEAPEVGGEGGGGGASVDVPVPGGAAGTDSGSVECEDQVSVRTARRARSSGYSGTEEDYFALYDEPCETASDCVAVCQTASGSEPMCEASECVEASDGGSTCLPAPVWRNLDSILFEGATPLDAVELTLVEGAYHDTLLTDDFRHEVPSGAEILGITAEVRRSGERAADYSVRILKAGNQGSAERALPEVWTPELNWITYGGADDLWGEEWEAADVTAEDFGLAISLTYTHDSGNSRAYVDQVRTSVHYRLPCE